MDRQLISLAVAILLISVWPGTMVDAALTPQQIENELAPHVGNTSHTPQITPNAIGNSTCYGRGDVRYRTLDALEFAYNTPTTKLGIMVLPWTGLPWFVVTTQELFNGGPKTRLDEVYIRCSGQYFRADLGRTVALWHWSGGVWDAISPPPPTPIIYAGDVTVSAFAPRGFTITCYAVPMTVDVALHSVRITLTPLHSAANSGVRGICGDYNGDATNDYDNLEPPILPPWKPLLVPP